MSISATAVSSGISGDYVLVDNGDLPQEQATSHGLLGSTIGRVAFITAFAVSALSAGAPYLAIAGAATGVISVEGAGAAIVTACSVKAAVDTLAVVAANVLRPHPR